MFRAEINAKNQRKLSITFKLADIFIKLMSITLLCTTMKFQFTTVHLSKFCEVNSFSRRIVLFVRSVFHFLSRSVGGVGNASVSKPQALPEVQPRVHARHRLQLQGKGPRWLLCRPRDRMSNVPHLCQGGRSWGTLNKFCFSFLVKLNLVRAVEV